RAMMAPCDRGPTEVRRRAMDGEGERSRASDRSRRGRVTRRVLLSWSSGKDSAWALHQLVREDDVTVLGLLTTFNESADRVAMHAVRRELVEAQAAATRVPLWPVLLPWPCSNAEYETRMEAALARARSEGVTHVAFGDLFLADIRAYREDRLRGSGIEPLFP